MSGSGKGRKTVRLEELRHWLAPGEAGEILGVSGQWVKQLVKRGELEGVETALGWLVDPTSIESVYQRRLEESEERIRTMKERRSLPPKQGRRSHGRTLKQKYPGDWTIENGAEA